MLRGGECADPGVVDAAPGVESAALEVARKRVEIAAVGVCGVWAQAPLAEQVRAEPIDPAAQ